MIQIIRSAWIVNRHRLTTGFLAFFSLFLFLTFVHHQKNDRAIATSRATGLSAIDSVQPSEVAGAFRLWPRHSRVAEPAHVDFSSALGSGASRPAHFRDVSEESPAFATPERAERYVVRVGTFEIIASDPLQIAERLRGLTGELSGFVVNFSASGSDRQTRSAQLSVRIPATSFDEARAQVRKIAGTVVRESIEARDVTRDYVDQDASLRNARAEEAEYLAILKHASAVKDILEVSSRLSEVRGRINESEADLGLLRNQVDMSLLTINISARQEPELFGLHWRPLQEAKESLRSALVGIGGLLQRHGGVVPGCSSGGCLGIHHHRAGKGRVDNFSMDRAFLFSGIYLAPSFTEASGGIRYDVIPTKKRGLKGEKQLRFWA
jgi:hypothetical protein